MEGVVFSFGREHVIKVCFDRSLEEVQRLSQFYAAAGGQVRVTQIDQVVEAVGRVVSVELFVAGTPLRADAHRRSPPSEGTAQSLADPLEGLAAVPQHAALSSLPLLPGAPGTSFTKALCDLVGRRVPAVSRTLDAALDGQLECVVGDPNLDVAITPAIFDVYGPEASLATEQLTGDLTAASAHLLPRSAPTDTHMR